MVNSVINYGAAVWGTRTFSCVDAVQHRAARFDLGLGKYAPNAAVMGDMGWNHISTDIWMTVFRHWKRQMVWMIRG